MIWNRELSTLLTKSAPLATSGLTATTEEAKSATSAIKLLRNYLCVSREEQEIKRSLTCAISKIYGEMGSLRKRLVYFEDVERVAARNDGTAVTTALEKRNNKVTWEMTVQRRGRLEGLRRWISGILIEHITLAARADCLPGLDPPELGTNHDTGMSTSFLWFGSPVFRGTQVKRFLYCEPAARIDLTVSIAQVPSSMQSLQLQSANLPSFIECKFFSERSHLDPFQTSRSPTPQ